MVRRVNIHTGRKEKKRVYSSRYALSSIVFCRECGEIYRRVHWNNRGYRSIVWRCVSRLEESGSACSSSTMNEKKLHNAVVKAINEVLYCKDDFLLILQNNISTVLNEESDIEEIDKKLDELQNEILRLANTKANYADVADEVLSLRELKRRISVQNAERQGKKQRIDEIISFLNEEPGDLQEYDEQMVRRFIEKITVFRDRLAVTFKSGIETDVKI